jgi:hypothetical protein
MKGDAIASEVVRDVGSAEVTGPVKRDERVCVLKLIVVFGPLTCCPIERSASSRIEAVKLRRRVKVTRTAPVSTKSDRCMSIRS